MANPLFDMKLHEVITLEHCHNVTVLRVHGGWIYYNHKHEKKGREVTGALILSNGVFVPYKDGDYGGP